MRQRRRAWREETSGDSSSSKVHCREGY